MTLSAALRAETGLAAAPRIDEVLAIADRLIAETGARNLTAFVLVERAALAALRGDAAQEARHLRRAHEEFRRMGATGPARDIAAALKVRTLRLPYRRRQDASRARRPREPCSGDGET